jgi:hypothetical protein
MSNFNNNGEFGNNAPMYYREDITVESFLKGILPIINPGRSQWLGRLE